MRMTGIVTLVIAALLMAMQPAAADPKHGGHGHGKSEKHANRGKGNGQARFAHGGPPPWAPAYGYRDGQETGTAQVADSPYDPQFEARMQADSPRISSTIGLNSGTCNRDAIGTVLGAVAGGVIANRTASAENRKVATVAGVVLGGIVGNTIGRTMDNRDVQCTGQALERVADQQTVTWKNTSNGQQYEVTPTRTYNQDGLYCREYVARTAGATRGETTQNACRNPDGTWKMVR